MAERKRLLRKIFTGARSRLPVDRTRALSELISQRLVALSFFSEARDIVLYAATAGEVLTDRIFREALAQGKRIFFPRADRQRKKLYLAQVSDLTQLKPGSYGVMEPDQGPFIEAGDLGNALVCVPGVAFAKDGMRLGFGKGYYDRFLAELNDGVVSVGLAFAFQLLDRLPHDPSDQYVNFVVTEYSVHPGKPLFSKPWMS